MPNSKCLYRIPRRWDLLGASLRVVAIFVALVTVHGLSLQNAGAQEKDAQDTASLYLRAWTYKDYSSMYALSAPSTRRTVSESQFYSAAARLVPPPLGLKIVERKKRLDALGGGESVYFQSGPVEAIEGSTTRGSLVVLSDGVLHPELLSLAPSAAEAPGPREPETALVSPSGVTVTSAGSARAAAATAVPKANSAVVDGVDIDHILSQMQNATEAAKTIRAEIKMRGSLMGTTLDESGKLIALAPNKARLETKSFLMNADGRRTMLYLPTANIVMDLAALGGGFELAPGFGTTVEEMKSKYSMSLAGQSTINGEPAYRLSMKSPESMAGLIGGGGSQITLFVSAKTWMPLRSSMQGVQIDFVNLQINAPGITEASFAWKTPASAQELSLGNLMGSLGQ